MLAILGRMRWTATTVAVSAAVAALLASGAVPVQCPFKAVFGVDCPGCGGSRMIGALLRGDPAAALGFNAFALLVGVPLGVGVLVAGARLELGAARRIWPAGRRGALAAVALGVAVVAWTVLRNLPFPPFTALRV